MDITTIIKNANPDIVIFLLTTLIAFASWIVKSLIEKPIADSKSTFNKFFEKRIEVLTEFKTRLNFIAYFPTGEDNLEYKKQIQEILLRDGKAAYLSKEVFDNIMRISIDETTAEELLLKTIKLIDDELYLKVSKVQDEMSFYRRFSNYNPLKRFVGLTLLSLQYIISLSIVVSVLLLTTIVFIEGNWCIRIGEILIGASTIYLINKWLKK